MRKKLFALTLAAGLTAVAGNQVKVYPAPDGAPLNSDFQLFVRPQGVARWQRVPCLRWKVDNAETDRHKVEETSVAHFDMEGCVEVMVVSQRQHVGEVRIRPLSYGLQPHVSGDTIRFSLDRSRYLSVEVNGDIFHNLQVLADPMVEQPTKKQLKRKDFIYYAPGYYEIDSLAVPSGATVYIDGGAYIKGFISVKGVRVFVPASQSGQPRDTDLSTMIKQPVKLRGSFAKLTPALPKFFYACLLTLRDLRCSYTRLDLIFLFLQS